MKYKKQLVITGHRVQFVDLREQTAPPAITEIEEEVAV